MTNNIKLVALDLDGTALNSKSEVSKYSKIILNKIAEDYILVPTTGRGFYGLRENLLKVENIRYVISANGAVVTDGYENKRLFEFLIDYHVALDLVNDYIQEDTLVYIHRNDEVSTHVCYWKNDYFNNMFDGIEKLDLIDFISNDKRDILKIGIRFIDQEDTLKAKSDIEKRYPMLNVFTVGNNALEITDKNASKWNALKNLCEKLNVSSDEVLAIGDNGNDIGMIEFAGVGVAMANSVQELKDVADFICEDNDHDGATKYLERRLLK